MVGVCCWYVIGPMNEKNDASHTPVHHHSAAVGSPPPQTVSPRGPSERRAGADRLRYACTQSRHSKPHGPHTSLVCWLGLQPAPAADEGESTPAPAPEDPGTSLGRSGFLCNITQGAHGKGSCLNTLFGLGLA
jgi:hypothetical protein